MKTTTATHRLSTGVRAIKLLPDIFCLEGRMVRSRDALAKFDIAVTPIGSAETFDIDDVKTSRAHEIADSLGLFNAHRS